MAKDFAYDYLGENDSIYHTMAGIYRRAKQEIDQKNKQRKLHEEKLTAVRGTKKRASTPSRSGKSNRRNLSLANGVRPKGKQTQIFGMH